MSPKYELRGQSKVHKEQSFDNLYQPYYGPICIEIYSKYTKTFKEKNKVGWI